MPTTTNYGWTTPADTDLVKDGASAIRTLGSSVDTTVKNLNPETTTGAIAYRGATANQKVALPIGTAGQVLQVNSGATAPEWATPSSGGMTLINAGGTTLTGASVTISSIPATYNNLQLVITNFKPATDNSILLARINNDSTANRYWYANVNDLDNGSFDEASHRVAINNDNSVADGLAIVNYYNYANTTTWKIFDIFTFSNHATTTTNFNYRKFHGAYNQTGAISSLVLFANSGNLTSGTAYLYGVK